MLNCDICGKKTMLKIFEKEGHCFYRCSSCRLEKIYPQPSDKQLSEIYNKIYYDAWGTQRDACEQAKKETFRNRLKLIPEGKNKKILDCGCAFGYLLEVARTQGFIPYGMDINPAALEILRQKFPPHQILEGRLEEGHFSPGSFYGIFMNDFLEHVRSPEAILASAYQLLESGGFLVISTPDTNSFTHRIAGRYWTHYKAEHLFYFNRNNIGVLLRHVHFRLLSVRRAWKCLTPDYLMAYIRRYPQKFISRVSTAIRFLPFSIRFGRIWFYCGEMVLVAQKP